MVNVKSTIQNGEIYVSLKDLMEIFEHDKSVTENEDVEDYIDYSLECWKDYELSIMRKYMKIY